MLKILLGNKYVSYVAILFEFHLYRQSVDNMRAAKDGLAISMGSKV